MDNINKLPYMCVYVHIPCGYLGIPVHKSNLPPNYIIGVTSAHVRTAESYKLRYFLDRLTKLSCFV